MAKRLLVESDKRLLWKLAWNMGLKGGLSVLRHKSRLKRGEVFPPFLYVSIINSCNLRCQGCWVDVAHKQHTIDPPAFRKLVREAKQMGNNFFGIVGGEPFMHPHLLDMLAEFPECYFQIFTNGHFITDERAKRMRELGGRLGDHLRRTPRPSGCAVEDDARRAELPEKQSLHRRLHELVQDEHR
jgi:sulfatase maturation enzyme AslB (radical SAM superfamily)